MRLGSWQVLASDPIISSCPHSPAVLSQQTLRKVKGILNKLTPEKFERLLSQLVPLVNSHMVVAGTIRQVFENAVAQPTFVVM